MEQELKPCPFCEGDAVFIDYPQSAQVHCLACTASVSEQTQAEAIAAWNTRPATRRDALEEAAKVAEALLEKHIQKCRDAVAECAAWSQPQAEWSRARDALLNFQDELHGLADKENNDG